MKAAYIEDVKKLSGIMQMGIIGLNTDEKRTIIKTPAGNYATRTSLFNSIGYGTDSPLEAAGIGLDLSENKGDYNILKKYEKPRKFPFSYIV
ncbi:MAG: hypothetical protein ABIE55_02580 [Candidatus Aenigmatarchaeota archaeon]